MRENAHAQHTPADFTGRKGGIDSCFIERKSCDICKLNTWYCCRECCDRVCIVGDCLKHHWHCKTTQCNPFVGSGLKDNFDVYQKKPWECFTFGLGPHLEDPMLPNNSGDDCLSHLIM